MFRQRYAPKDNPNSRIGPHKSGDCKPFRPVRTGFDFEPSFAPC